MFILSGKLSLSTLRWVPMCKGFSHYSDFLHHFVLAKLASSSIRVKLMNANQYPRYHNDSYFIVMLLSVLHISMRSVIPLVATRVSDRPYNTTLPICTQGKWSFLHNFPRWYLHPIWVQNRSRSWWVSDRSNTIFLMISTPNMSTKPEQNSSCMPSIHNFLGPAYIMCPASPGCLHSTHSSAGNGRRLDWNRFLKRGDGKFVL